MRASMLAMLMELNRRTIGIFGPAYSSCWCTLEGKLDMRAIEQWPR